MEVRDFGKKEEIFGTVCCKTWKTDFEMTSSRINTYTFRTNQFERLFHISEQAVLERF